MVDYANTTSAPPREQRENTSIPVIWTPSYPIVWRGYPSKTHFLSPEYKSQKVEEFYKSYNFMTGVRIAATLGGLIALFTLFLLYKSKCKTYKDYKQQLEDIPTCRSVGVAQEEISTRGSVRSDNSSTASDSGSISLHLAEPFSPCPDQTGIPLTIYVENSSSLFLPSDVYIEEDIHVTNDTQLYQTDQNTWMACEPQPSASSTQVNKLNSCSNSKESAEFSVTNCEDGNSERPSSLGAKKKLSSRTLSVRPSEQTEGSFVTERYSSRSSVKTNEVL
ncbi:uncharacterized protein LOC111085639 [Limulus polyphemus]|uniref:Uncharacterized protein LOC111085639 n=1 Tax=Limulus polyphemus TaxID=6850 RepID=A0ABM1SBB3_LIMPO|nr:uncharacterized protein LOC111085639 [Limulus polyphemus]